MPRRSAAEAPLQVGPVGLPAFRQPEPPSSPQEAPGTAGTAPGATTVLLTPQDGPQPPLSNPHELWTPSGATPPDAGPAGGPGLPPHAPADASGLPLDEPWNENGASSPTSTPADRLTIGLTEKEIRANRRTLKPVIGTAVETVTTFAHEGLARDDYEVHVGVYLADEDDVENVSDPAAGILSRRMPAGSDNPDLADGIRLMFALAGYVAKQFGKLNEAKRMRARQLLANTAGEAERETARQESSPGWPMQSPPPAPEQGAA